MTVSVPKLQAENLLIVETDSNFSSLLRIMLENLGMEQVVFASNFQDGLEQFFSDPPDICLIGIDLGKGRSGIELAEQIRQTDAQLPIIFLTDQYSIEAYERCRHTFPSSFLTKELSEIKLFQTLDLAMLARINSVTIWPSRNGFNRGQKSQSVFFKVGDTYKSIPIEKVSYFYSEHKTNFAQVYDRCYPTNVSLRTLEEELAPEFLRIHKSFLVNVRQIDSIQPAENTIVINDQTLPIGQAYRKSFMEGIKLLK